MAQLSADLDEATEGFERAKVTALKTAAKAFTTSAEAALTKVSDSVNDCYAAHQGVTILLLDFFPNLARNHNAGLTSLHVFDAQIGDHAHSPEPPSPLTSCSSGRSFECFAQYDHLQRNSHPCPCTLSTTSLGSHDVPKSLIRLWLTRLQKRRWLSSSATMDRCVPECNRSHLFHCGSFVCKVKYLFLFLLLFPV